MDYLKILHENPDLADEFDSLFDFSNRTLPYLCSKHSRQTACRPKLTVLIMTY